MFWSKVSRPSSQVSLFRRSGVSLPAAMLAFVLLGVAALLAAAWLYFSWNFNYWKDRGVVSYNPFSVTGDRGDGLPIGKPFFQWLDYGYSKYKGKQRFVGTFQARRPVLVALDPEFIKTVLTKDFGSFHSRGMPIDEQGDPLSVNLVFLSGIRWKNLRMKLSPVFTSGKLKLMYPLMVDITKELNGRVRALAATGNNEVEFKDLLVRYSTDIIGSVAFGIDCSTLSGENQQFMDMSRTIVNRNLLNVIRFILVSVHPIFAKLLPFKLLFSEMTNFFLNLMKDTVEYRETNQVLVGFPMARRRVPRTQSPLCSRPACTMFATLLVVLGVFSLQVNGWLPDKDDFTDMKVGQTFSALVLQNGKGWIDVILKDGELMSIMTLFGTTPEGALRYEILSGCRNGYEGCVIKKVLPEQKQDFPSGELVFAVEWRPSEIAVWLLSAPQHVATMAVPDSAQGHGRLRVRVALAPVAGVKTEFAVLQRDGSKQNQTIEETVSRDG